MNVNFYITSTRTILMFLFDFLVEVLKKRWKNLKDYRNKTNKTVLSTGVERNDDIEEESESVVHDDFQHELSFLDQTETERATISNVVVIADNTDVDGLIEEGGEYEFIEVPTIEDINDSGMYI